MLEYGTECCQEDWVYKGHKVAYCWLNSSSQMVQSLALIDL